MKPTFVRVGVPKSKTRAPLTVRPPTSAGSPPSALSNVRCSTTLNVASGVARDWLIPSGTVSGDGILVFVNTETLSSGINPPSGYTELYTRDDGNNNHKVYWKVSDGTETDTSWTSNGTGDAAYVAGRIPANGATLTTPEITSYTSTPSTANVDPPAISPTGAPGTYHVIVGILGNKGGPNPDAEGALSTGYSLVNECDTSNGLLSPHIVIEQKASTAITTTEDPGTYAWAQTAGSRYFSMLTIAVKADIGADPTVVGYPVQVGDIDSEASTDGQVITSDGAGGAAWEDIPAPDLSAASIDDLSDVDTTSTPPTSGDVLEFDGTNWVPGDGEIILHGVSPQSDGSLRFEYGVDASGRPTYTAAGTTDTEAIVLLGSDGRPIVREVTL